MLNNGLNGNGNGSHKFDWLQLIYQEQLFVDILSDLGYHPGTGALAGLDHNPITNALAAEMGESTVAFDLDGKMEPVGLAAGSFAERMTERHGKEFNRTSLSKLATICQMLVFNNLKGPEQDGKPKALRRHWYAWYKVKFAQPFAYQLGDYTTTDGVIVYNDIAWSQRLSQTYAWFVDNARYTPNDCPDCHQQELSTDWYDTDKWICHAENCDWNGTLEDVTCTYRDLWVEDASRMIARTHGELFLKSHIIIAVEKDSLFGDFEAAAKSLGATCIISGKGKSSKAAIEKMLRDFFGWSSQPRTREVWDQDKGTYISHALPPIFSRENPIHVIHVSDHDFDGESVIGPTFAEQIRRYTPHVKEARVGIKPEDLAAKGYNVADQMYSVKLSNKGYKKWADNQALFLGECVNNKEHVTLTKGTVDYSDSRQPGNWPNSCHECGGAFVTLRLAGEKPAIAYGLEVEAMRVSDYRDLLVKALLTILDFDYIVERLRLETLAYDELAAQQIRDNMLRGNQSYQDLLADFETLERKKRRFENAIMKTVWPITARQADAYPHQGNDQQPADYIVHVERSDWGPWRPFSADVRTEWLVEDAENHHLYDLLYAWQYEHYDDYDNDTNNYVDTSQF